MFLTIKLVFYIIGLNIPIDISVEESSPPKEEGPNLKCIGGKKTNRSHLECREVKKRDSSFMV